MKTVTIALALLLGSVSFAQVEEGKRKEDKLSVTEKAEKRTQKMTDLLNLSEDQKEKVYAINLKHVQEMEKLKQEKDELRNKMKASHDFAKKEFDKILSNEQQSILKEKKEEMKKKKKEKRDCCKESKHE